jgi:hypothetical protein
MPTFPRRPALLAVVTALLSIAPMAAAVPATASGAPGQVTVMLSLKPGKGAAAPSNAAGKTAADFLRSNGFTLTRQSRWLVSARGPQAAAESAFGTRLATQGRTVRTTSPVRVPAALQGVVAAVSGLDTTRTWRPHVVPGGLTSAEMRAAYDVSPLGDGAGVTVASVQFSGWRAQDLQDYADAAGLAAPDVTEIIALDGDSTSMLDPDGAFEAAMDAETLLATAPAAKQRMYFAGNSDAGAIDAYDRIATDAEAGLVDVVSVSWGQCEDDLTPETRTAIDSSLARVVAAGRTVFAASGDFGVYDCHPTSPHGEDRTVDYPASSVHVVGVGGTTISHGRSWSDVAWNQPETSDSAPYSSGGGFSHFAARPSWQPATTPDDPVGPAPKMRVVPDIAAVADPNTSMLVYVENAGGWNHAGGTSEAAAITAGHFAATLSAAGLTNGLGADLRPLLYANPSVLRDVTSGANNGYAAGTGYDLVTGLGSPMWSRVLSLITDAPIVSAPETGSSTTIPLTITAPAGTTFSKYQICTNDVALTCSTPDLLTLPDSPSLVVDAGTRRLRVVVVGWDADGVPHPGVAYHLLDDGTPTAAAAAALITTAGTRATFSWAGTDPVGGSGVLQYHARVTKRGTSTPVLDYTGALTSRTSTLSAGGFYTLVVRTEDRAGNLSVPATATLSVPYDQSQLAISRGWRLTRSSADYRGSAHYSATRGAKMTKTVNGSSVDLMVTTKSTGGYAKIYVNSRYVRRINTYSATTRHRVYLRIANWSTNGTRRIDIVVAGSKSAASRGTRVEIDGLRVNRR